MHEEMNAATGGLRKARRDTGGSRRAELEADGSRREAVRGLGWRGRAGPLQGAALARRPLPTPGRGRRGVWAATWGGRGQGAEAEREPGWVTSRVADGPAAPRPKMCREGSLGRGDSASQPPGEGWSRPGGQSRLPPAPPSRTDLPTRCSTAARSAPPSTAHPGRTLQAPPECIGGASPSQKPRVALSQWEQLLLGEPRWGGDGPGSGGSIPRRAGPPGFGCRGPGCRARALGEAARAVGQ